MHEQKLITKYLKDYLIPKGTQPGKAQDNPKIYKKNHPFITIINGSNHATEKMAKVVEKELSENVRNLNTYIKDTTYFLQKLNNISQPQPNETIMFCLEAKALYLSVSRIEAKSACKTAFENRTTKTISTDSVLEMMDLVLENNNLRFDNKHSLQTDGTAIGSHLGMNYDCTYLGNWEQELYSKSKYLPSHYWRYVDNIWGIWHYGL
jgi:hypothetical protein